MKVLFKKILYIAFLLLFVFTIFSCEQSLTALANEIADSQPRDDTRLSQIVIVQNTQNSSKVDAAALISARGIHCFSSIYTGSEAIDPDLQTPRYKNDKRIGLYSRLYIPDNYNSNNLDYKKILVKTNRTDLEYDDDPMYFVFDPSDPNSKLTEAVMSFTNIPKFDTKFGYKSSASIASKYFLYRTDTGTLTNPIYTYYISKIIIEKDSNKYKVKLDHNNAITIYTDSESSKRNITKIWESDNQKYAVVMYVNNESQDYRYKCRYATVNIQNKEFTPITQINEQGNNSPRNLYFEQFIVYDDRHNNKIIWMGFTRAGAIYHSHSTNTNTLQIKDGSWTFYRYAPIVKLMLPQNEIGDTNEYGVCLFARYTNNGFLLSRFLKLPNSDNKILVNYTNSSGSSYSNSYTITSGFAQKLRSEEISYFGFLPQAYQSGDQTVLVATVKAGASTYRLSNVVPYLNRDGSNGTENRDRIILPFV